MFGGETRGLPDDARGSSWRRCTAFPMPGTGVRSLNLANAVSVVLYEGLRQLGRV